MFGDVLRKRIAELKNSSAKRNDKNAFWKILINIAAEDIRSNFPHKVDSDIAVPLYYEILSSNLDNIPPYFREKLKSNNQERFRIANRNIFTSNAFHEKGLANQEGIIAIKQINEYKKGNRIIYQGVKK